MTGVFVYPVSSTVPSNLRHATHLGIVSIQKIDVCIWSHLMKSPIAQMTVVSACRRKLWKSAVATPPEIACFITISASILIGKLQSSIAQNLEDAFVERTTTIIFVSSLNGKLLVVTSTSCLLPCAEVH